MSEWNELLQIIESHVDRKLSSPRFTIIETGDVDRGTYKKHLKSITFQTHEKTDTSNNHFSL